MAHQVEMARLAALSQLEPAPECSDPIEVTIVMPCLNEAETLARCILKARSGLADAKVRGEIVVADNGSTDGSIEIAEQLGARVVPVKEKGYGSALRGGILAARGTWVIMGDSDDSYDFSQLAPFVEKLRQGCDLVMGCRMPWGGGRIQPGAMPWKHRWLGNPVLSAIGRIFFGCPVTDFHCGLRGFSAAAFRRMQLRTTGMEFASEMVIKATLKGMRIAQVPITLHKDGRSRPPHLRSWRDGWRHLRFMLLFSPKWLFVWPGATLFLLGLLVSIPLAIRPVSLGAVELNTNTLLVASMTALVGFQVLFFGVFSHRYCVARGLLPEGTGLHPLVRVLFSLERGIVAGLLVVGVGLGFLAKALVVWKSAGFGQIPYAEGLRLVIPAVACVMLGVQTVFSSFFLSILDLKHD